MGERFPPEALGGLDVVTEPADDVVAILTTPRAPVSAELIARLPALRIVATASVGYDHVDIEAADARGIVVRSVPDYCTEEVADHTLALLYALLRGVVALDRQVAAGRWDAKGAGPLRTLAGLRVGIVGHGRIGGAVSTRLLALGAEVWANDIVPVAATASARRPRRAARRVRRCHAARSADRRDARADRRRAISLMRPDALLLNTSRGAVVDVGAVLEALRARPARRRGARRAAAGAAAEPPVAPNLIVTPHAAYYSEAAERRAVEAAVAPSARRSAHRRRGRPKGVSSPLPDRVRNLYENPARHASQPSRSSAAPPERGTSGSATAFVRRQPGRLSVGRREARVPALERSRNRGRLPGQERERRRRSSRRRSARASAPGATPTRTSTRSTSTRSPGREPTRSPSAAPSPRRRRASASTAARRSTRARSPTRSSSTRPSATDPNFIPSRAPHRAGAPERRARDDVQDAGRERRRRLRRRPVAARSPDRRVGRLVGRGRLSEVRRDDELHRRPDAARRARLPLAARRPAFTAEARVRHRLPAAHVGRPAAHALLPGRDRRGERHDRAATTTSGACRRRTTRTADTIRSTATSGTGPSSAPGRPARPSARTSPAVTPPPSPSATRSSATATRAMRASVCSPASTSSTSPTRHRAAT